MKREVRVACLTIEHNRKRRASGGLMQYRVDLVRGSRATRLARRGDLD